jgi:hypothetical protein
MTVQPRISLTTALRAVATAWAATSAVGWVAGCQLEIEGAACPCGPGWICLEAEEAEEAEEAVCVRPYCVFWTYEQRAGGIDVELPEDLVVVTSYTSAVPPGSDILVTGSGTLSITSGDHRIFVEPYGVVLNLGDDNQVYLREHALYLTERGERNVVIHEPDAAFPLGDPEVVLQEEPAIDFVGLVEAPFATTFREISGRQIDADQGGIDDYVVRSGAVLYFPRARADNIFVESVGLVFSLDYSSVAYLQSEALFNAGGKRHVIHYVAGATIDNAGASFLIEHAAIELDLCTM